VTVLLISLLILISLLLVVIIAVIVVIVIHGILVIIETRVLPRPSAKRVVKVKPGRLRGSSCADN
jgi:hypothetical protein